MYGANYQKYARWVIVLYQTLRCLLQCVISRHRESLLQGRESQELAASLTAFFRSNIPLDMVRTYLNLLGWPFSAGHARHPNDKPEILWHERENLRGYSIRSSSYATQLRWMIDEHKTGCVGPVMHMT